MDPNNQPKVNYVYTGSQQTETPAEGSLKFSTTGDYAMTCTWDEKTEKLAIHMEGPDKYTQDVGPLDLAAVITYHSEYVYLLLTIIRLYIIADYLPYQKVTSLRPSSQGRASSLRCTILKQNRPSLGSSHRCLSHPRSPRPWRTQRHSSTGQGIWPSMLSMYVLTLTRGPPNLPTKFMLTLATRSDTMR